MHRETFPVKKIVLDKLSWIKTKSLKQHLSVDILLVNLGRGESETIALALELKAGLIILDELAARNIAESLNLRFSGTLGILLKAKKQNLIPSVKEAIDALIKQEFRLSTRLYQDILEFAEEQQTLSPVKFPNLPFISLFAAFISFTSPLYSSMYL